MLNSRKSKPSILLHICCVGCGAYVSDFLKTNFEVVLYFFNPNIFPKEEYDVRLKETERIANKFRFQILLRSDKSTDLIKAIKMSKNVLCEVDMDPIDFV